MTTKWAVVSPRVLLAHEQELAAGALERTISSLGFVVVAATVAVAEAVSLLLAEAPDVAVVGFAERPGHALGVIEALVAERVCPVVAVVQEGAEDFAARASARGVWAVVGESELAARLPACIDVARRRFGEHSALAGALDRRIVVERASGILMERHGVDGPTAFAMLRKHARDGNAKVVDVAGAVIGGHALLPSSGTENAAKETRQAPR